MNEYFDYLDGNIDGYHVQVGSDLVYIPSDRVQYITVKSDGTLYNLSSSTITCYALDSNGNRGNQYRLVSYGSMEKYTYYSNQYNSWYQWDSVTARASDSNITFGQTGLHSYTEVLLFCILLVVGASFLIKGKSHG